MTEQDAGLGDWLVAATATCALAACVAGLLREAPSLPAAAPAEAPAPRLSWVRLAAPPGAGEARGGPAAAEPTDMPQADLPRAPEGLAPLAELPGLPAAPAPSRADAAAGGTSSAGGGPARLVRESLGGGQPWPEYPAASRRRGEEGTVTVRLSVDASGAVTAATVASSSGWRSLDEAASGTVRRRWSFPPGEPRDYLVDIRFELL